MTSKRVAHHLNSLRGLKAAKKADKLANAAKVDAGAPQQRLRYVIDTYLKSTFLYNATPLPNLSKLVEIGDKMDRKLLREVLRFPDRSLDANKLGRLTDLFQLTPLVRKVEKDGARFVKRMR